MSEAKRVLITGGAGYLGSLLVAKLANQKQSSATHFNLSGKNSASSAAAHTIPAFPVDAVVSCDVRAVPEEDRLPNVTYLVADVRTADFTAMMREHRINVVVHLAAILAPPGKLIDRNFIYEVDVVGTRNVLDACLAAGVQKIIISSSGASYGYHADNPEWLTEDHPVRGNPDYSYSDHKRQVEEMLADYRSRHPELQQIVFRIGTILGDTVNNQITNLFQKKTVPGVSGSDSPFVFIWDWDVVGAILFAIGSERQGVFNLAGDGKLTIDELAEMLGKKARRYPVWLLATALFIGKTLGLSRYGPEQLKFLRYRPVLLNTKLKEELGYIPQKTTREVFAYYLQSAYKETSQSS